MGVPSMHGDARPAKAHQENEYGRRRPVSIREGAASSNCDAITSTQHFQPTFGTRLYASGAMNRLVRRVGHLPRGFKLCRIQDSRGNRGGLEEVTSLSMHAWYSTASRWGPETQGYCGGYNAGPTRQPIAIQTVAVPRHSRTRDLRMHACMCGCNVATIAREPFARVVLRTAVPFLVGVCEEALLPFSPSFSPSVGLVNKRFSSSTCG